MAKILVVDDDPDFVRLTRTIFQSLSGIGSLDSEEYRKHHHTRCYKELTFK